MTYTINISVRPKSNSSYTAKKIFNIASVSCPSTKEFSDIANNSQDWTVLTYDELKALSASVRDTFINEVKNCDIIKNADLTKGFDSIDHKDQQNALVEMAMAYIVSANQIENYKIKSAELADMIAAIDLLNISADLYNNNNHIEVLIKVQCQ